MKRGLHLCAWHQSQLQWCYRREYVFHQIASSPWGSFETWPLEKWKWVHVRPAQITWDLLLPRPLNRCDSFKKLSTLRIPCIAGLVQPFAPIMASASSRISLTYSGCAARSYKAWVKDWVFGNSVTPDRWSRSTYHGAGMDCRKIYHQNTYSNLTRVKLTFMCWGFNQPADQIVLSSRSM